MNMPAPKNVLMIVVDQWRGLMLPKLGADYLKLPNLDRLCAEGVTFRNHFTQAVPCGPARASLLTGQYLMNHRAVQNTIPLVLALHQPGARAAARRLRSGAGGLHDDDARSAQDRAQRSALLRAGRHHGGLPFGRRLREPQDAYFGWVAGQGFKLPKNREEVWLPQGEPGAGATGRPAVIPKELSDTAWFTERGLTYLRGRAGKPWFLHLGYYRPHPPFIVSGTCTTRMYRPEDMPKPVRAAVRGGRGEAERAARLLCEQRQAGELLPGRQGPRLGR